MTGAPPEKPSADVPASPGEPSAVVPAPASHKSWLVQLLLLVIRGYQLLLSPLLGPVCRFHPSCSRYTAECLRLHGAARGCFLGMRRILRCHPWNAGGYDPPPPPLQTER